jgi:HEAT repeat protein
LIDEYKSGDGPEYTDALAQALPKLPAEVAKEARRALIDRMKRMSSKTLRDKLTDENAEVRRAAANACANKGDRELIPNLIAVVVDEDPAVAKAAGFALNELTGQDFGPRDSSTTSARASAQRDWQEWWAKHKP